MGRIYIVTCTISLARLRRLRIILSPFCINLLMNTRLLVLSPSGFISARCRARI
jgi:hypothetical protein